MLRMLSPWLKAWVLLLAGLILLAGGDAIAGKAAAKKHFKKGQTHYKLGRFSEALAEYSKAYEEMEHAAFLFNIGQCHMELENYERAVFFYERYLSEKPESPNRVLVDERLAAARTKLGEIEEEKRRQQEQAREEMERERQEEIRAQEQERLRLEEERQRLEADRQRLEAERLAREQAEAEATARVAGNGNGLAATSPPGPEITGDEAPVYEKLWFWSAVGGAAVATAVTITILAVTTGGRTTTVLPAGDLPTIDARTP